MRRPAPAINCASSPECGATGDECHLYSVVAGIATLYSFACTNRGVVRPAPSLSTGAGVRAWTRISESRSRQLPAIRGSRSDGHEHPVHLRVFGNRAALGPAVRLSEGNPGCPGAAHSSYVRAN